jgi:hypothetical protein
MSDLRCTYCAGPLSIEMRREGRPYLSYEVPDYIECDDWSCGAEWEPNGDLRTAGKSKS